MLVFNRSQEIWTHTQTLPGGSASIFNEANSLAIGSDFIALGDPSFNNARGGAHIFVRKNGKVYVYKLPTLD